MYKLRHHTPDEDAALVASWRSGETASFESLVRKHQKRMFNIAFRITGDYDDSCELVQDAFVAACRGIDSFRGAVRFSTWLASITVSKSRDSLQRATGVRKMATHFSHATPAPNIGASAHEWLVAASSALEQLERAAIADKLQGCIRTLSVEFRELIVLRDIEGFTYNEICAILKTREGTVKSRLYRARELVKDCLKKAVGEL